MLIVFLVLDVDAYIPDALVPQYLALKDTFLSWLEKLGIVRAKRDAAEGEQDRPVGSSYLLLKNRSIIASSKCIQRC